MNMIQPIPKPKKRKGLRGRRWDNTRKEFLRGKLAWGGYYICESCGRYIVNIEVDHIKKRSTHPELVFDLSNLRALCHSCHNYATNHNQELPGDNFSVDSL